MVQLRTAVGVALAALVMGVVVESPGDRPVAPTRVAAFVARRSRPRTRPRPASYGDGPDWDGKPPPGVQPLAMDLFKSKDFYKDRGQCSTRVTGDATARDRSPTCAAAAQAPARPIRASARTRCVCTVGNCAKDWRAKTS